MSENRPTHKGMDYNNLPQNFRFLSAQESRP